MAHTPTPEQQAIIDAAKQTSDSLLISALAGAAKTSTLEMICRALPSTPVLSLAFNKRIADELKTRLPGNASPATLNAIGHRAWAGAIGRRLIVNADKNHTLLKEAIDTKKGKDKERLYDDFAEIRKTIGKAKLAGYIPHGVGRGTPLVDRAKFYESLEEELPEMYERLIDDILRRGISLALDGTIDFDDQIYMPTLFGSAFPQYPLVMIDEAQDLSSINHQMLAKIARKRLIAVGDPYQSIYGFRGAVQSGMDTLRTRFDLRDLGLSVSFRCPVSVVELARSRAPHMQYPEWAKPGLVAHHETWKPDLLPFNASIICRNNAPLLKLGFKLIQAGRGIKIIGADIGPGMIRTLEKFGDGDISQALLHERINGWEAEKLAKARAQASVRDRAECFRVFADQADTLSGAVAYAKHIFAATGSIQLMTGHKSKGLEFDNVFFLDPEIVGAFAKSDEEAEQEKNLRYVIQTRSKSELHHVTTEGFQA